MKKKIIERFVRYVKFDTESVFDVQQIPSTDKQRDLAVHLVEELKKIGLSDVSVTENCYVLATLPANTTKTDVPVVGFVAHLDTSPDFTGKNVNPKIWENYQGTDLVLNEAQNIVLHTKDFPEILAYKGQTIITTDGTTLLGADDKAGVTEIVSAMEYLLTHPEILHGTIKICFTPDEEVGKGADAFPVETFGAVWAYTMDGSSVGELEYENFNAAYAKITFKGKNVHPGYAKDKMINSQYYAVEFMKQMPEDEVPECTENYDGFFHLLHLKGSVEQTTLEYIIRDFDKEQFEDRKELLRDICAHFQKALGKDAVTLELREQYRNMREKIEPNMRIVRLAEQAMKNLGIVPKIKPIRGGTDGARLSFMGLPCPNIFAGGENFHSRYEYVPVESMEKATMTIVEICRLLASEKV
jgi:tripeptide aminopeptidase